MGRGNGGSRSTLRDAASGFLAQWNASKVGDAPALIEPRLGLARNHGKDGEQTFRSWKRGGGEVKVTRGPSVGYQKRLGDVGKSSIDRALPGTAVKAEIRPKQIAIPHRTPSLSPPPPTPKKSIRQRLSEASADPRTLKISAAMSRSHGFVELPPVIEDKEGRLAILGLDFGTAFTKAVVRWSGRHYAIDWSGVVEGDDQYLLASVFSEAPDGRCTLGAQEASEWGTREGIKLRLLSPTVTATGEYMADAVIFIALTFRYVDGWLRRMDAEAAKGIRWRLHVGLPTKSWDDDATAETFKTVAQAARVLACMPGPVTRATALEALHRTDQIDRPAVDVLPEFACQLYSYLLSPECGGDLHALVDVGAGTIDVAYFNVFMKDGEAQLPIFASEVEKLGAHYLIAALSGATGHLIWEDGESSMSDEEVGRKLACASSDVFDRRRLYLNAVGEVFDTATCTARQMYPTSPAFRRRETVRLFLCGGGSRIPSLHKKFEKIARRADKFGVTFQISELVKPRDLVGNINSEFDRLSVAYGLSQNAANIGRVMRSATLEPLLPKGRSDQKHRDDDR